MKKFLYLMLSSSVFTIFLFIVPAKTFATQSYDSSESPSLMWTQYTSSWFPHDNKVHSSGVFVVGSDNDFGDTKWIIEKRNLVTGELIPSFGTNGVIEYDPSSGEDVAYSIVVVGNDMYVAGYDSNTAGSDTQWRIEKRDVTTGHLIHSFGTNGVVNSNPSNLGDTGMTILYHNNALYIGGSDGQPGNSQWRIEKRDTSTGYLIDSFGTNGIVVDNICSNTDYIMDMALDDTYLYIIGTDNTDISDMKWLIQKRNLTNGYLVASFGTNGELSINPRSSTGNEYPYGIAIDENALYPTGHETITAADYQWYTEKRRLSDGSIVSRFGTNGIVTYDSPLGGYYDRVFDVTVGDGDLYLVGDTYLVAGVGGAAMYGRIERRDLTSGDLKWAENFTTNQASRHYSVVFDDGNIYISGRGSVISDVMNEVEPATSVAAYTLKYSYPRYPYFINIPGTSTLINLSEGQIITVDPYIIKVKPEDDLGIVRVLFFIDDVQICEVTTPDADGVYSCSWDTSTYHSDVRVVAYDTQGYTATISRSVDVGLPETGEFIWTYEILGVLFVFASIALLAGKQRIRLF